MTCRICGAQRPEGMSRCPKCRFPVLRSFGSQGQAERQKLEQLWKKTHGYDRLSGTEIGVLAYFWDRDSDGKVREISRYRVLLPADKELDQQLLWLNCFFARTSREEYLQLPLRFVRGREVREQTVRIRCPADKGPGFWNVALAKTDDGQLRIALGGPRNYEQSICDIP